MVKTDKTKFKKKDWILVYVDDEPHYQIRLEDDEGMNIWWKFVPLVEDYKERKGLHIAKGKIHFDFYVGRKKQEEKDYLAEQGIGGVFMTNKGLFAIPLQYILIWGSNHPTFYTPEKFKEKEGFKAGSFNDLNEGGYI